MCKLRANNRQQGAGVEVKRRLQVEMESGVTTGRRARVKQQALHRRTGNFFGPLLPRLLTGPLESLPPASQQQLSSNFS